VTTSKNRTLFYTDKILLAKIDKFRFKFGFASRSKAIAWLVTWALSKNPTPPPQKDDDEYYE